MSVRKKARVINEKGNSGVDELSRKIQPSLEERGRVLDARHVACFAEVLPIVDLSEIREALKRKKKIRKQCTADIYERKMKERREKERRKKKEEKRKSAQEEMQTEDEVDEVENDDGTEENAKTNEEMKTTETSGDKSAVDGNGRKMAKKRRREKSKKMEKIREDEDIDCDSICSFDSDICLAGVTLTVEDKREIEDNRRRIQNNGARSEE